MKKFAALAAVVGCLLAGCGSTTHKTVKAPPPAPCPAYRTPYGCQAHSATFGLPPAKAGLLPPAAATSGVTMFDSVTLSTIPAKPPAVAGYLSGLFPTWHLLSAAFPSAVRVPIAIAALPVYKSLGGRMVCLDVEPGDATPVEAGPWAKGEIGLGVKPCVYANLSTMPAVKASLLKWLGSGWRSLVFLWDADWTFTPRLDVGYDATQWTDHYAGRNLDASLATKAFLGINPPPPLPVCFHRRMTRFECNGVKEQIAKDLRAAASSERAFTARGCDVLRQRVSWFSTRLRKHPKVKTQYRRGALRASQRAYVKASCPTFAQRQRYFAGAAARLKAGS